MKGNLLNFKNYFEAAMNYVALRLTKFLLLISLKVIFLNCMLLLFLCIFNLMKE